MADPFDLLHELYARCTTDMLDDGAVRHCVHRQLNGIHNQWITIL